MPEEKISNFEIILGTYEEFTLGYKFCYKDKVSLNNLSEILKFIHEIFNFVCL